MSGLPVIVCEEAPVTGIFGWPISERLGPFDFCPFCGKQIYAHEQTRIFEPTGGGIEP